MSTTLDLQGIEKRYGATRAVAGVDLSVAPGELVALLGPSGCGKTTTLRMVAGFVEPSAGRILMAGTEITRMPPHRRNAGMVFQSYALFPHLSVADNIAFGLRRRGVGRGEIAERVAKMVALLQLDGLEQRLPKQLSGGQQQRVAVGRALVINPAVLLLDEPFSNLDALLRDSTRMEMRRLQTTLGLTTLFVTHDQAEAMAISDRIAVMHHGRIEQIGTPRDIYDRPATRFVAGFIGRANLFDAPEEAGLRLAPAETSPAACWLLRPESVTLDTAPAEGPNAVAGTVEVVSFLGTGTHLSLRLPSGRILLAEGPPGWADTFRAGAAATARWDGAALVAVRGA
jgi:putative spermidine/putrescine transport system ATP-binding protein